MIRFPFLPTPLFHTISNEKLDSGKGLGMIPLQSFDTVDEGKRMLALVNQSFTMYDVIVFMRMDSLYGKQKN